MNRVRHLLAVAFVLSIAPAALPQAKKGGHEPALETAHGTVDKADKDSVSIKPRTATGQFHKELTVRITGTSKITVLTPQNRTGKVVLTQRDADAKDLVPGQAVAVIYSTGADGPVLLSAVVMPAAGK